MNLTRRQMLGLTLGSVGSCLINPLKAFGWGSFDGLANTHALIVQNAMRLLRNDPALNVTPFPAVNDIISNDWVSAFTSGTYGTGPDVEGRSNYSEHYYNPKTGRGGGLAAVKKHYINLIKNIVNNKTGPAASKSAAWAAHFLSDMHVPYHMVGIPAEEAFQRRNSNIGNLSFDESGPSYLYNDNSIPYGWGNNQGFHEALHWFTTYNPKTGGKIGAKDWYDPWYYNGVGNHISSVVTGSHAWWEIEAHRIFASGSPLSLLNNMLAQDRYDPLWANPKISFDYNPMNTIGSNVENYAMLCANGTRARIKEHWQNPSLGYCRAIRAAMTLFRAAMTTIKINPIEYRRLDNSTYKVLCWIKNMNEYEALQNIRIQFKWRRNNGEWRKGIVRLNQGIQPLRINGGWWDIPVRANEKLEVVCNVLGEYYHTPDLGYNYKQIFINVDGNIQEPTPEPIHRDQPSPIDSECPIPPGATLEERSREKNARVKRYSKIVNGRDELVGPEYQWYDKERRHIKVINCYDQNGKPHGLQTNYREDGSISSQFYFKHGGLIDIPVPAN